MKYVIKEEFWALADKFHIYDEYQRPIFFVDGKVFSWGDQLSFQDMQGNELAFISQKLMTLMPKYEIHRNGQLFAEVLKEWSWFEKKFTLDVPGPNDYTIDGKFWTHEYVFRREGQVVATVSKAYFSWSDSYGIDISEGEDDISILCTAIVIDQVLHDDKK